MITCEYTVHGNPCVDPNCILDHTPVSISKKQLIRKERKTQQDTFWCPSGCCNGSICKFSGFRMNPKSRRRIYRK